MSNTSFLIKIDPYTEAVYPIGFSERLSDLTRWTGGKTIFMLGQIANDDLAIVSGESFKEQYVAPAWLFIPTNELYFGTAIWANVNEEGLLREPLLTVEDLRSRIEFIGFIEAPVTVEYIPLDEGGHEATGNTDPDEQEDDLAF